MAYNQVSPFATKIYASAGLTVVQYHATRIVQFDDKQIVLDAGHWQSATTKKKMNQASHQFGLGYTVNQENFVWTVTLWQADADGDTHPIASKVFHDGITIARDTHGQAIGFVE